MGRSWPAFRHHPTYKLHNNKSGGQLVPSGKFREAPRIEGQTGYTSDIAGKYHEFFIFIDCFEETNAIYFSR
jgi:hypothetical protein